MGLRFIILTLSVIYILNGIEDIIREENLLSHQTDNQLRDYICQVDRDFLLITY